MTKPARRLEAVWCSTLLVTACTSGPAARDDAAPGTDSHPRVDAAEPGPDAGVDADDPSPDAGRDGGPSQLDLYQSGSRLKMRVGTTPDGAKTFLGWRDTMRNEDCGFLVAADGQVRCLPGVAANYAPDLFWADSGCTTTPLAYAAAGCPIVTGYARAVTTCAPLRFTIYALGAHYAGVAYVKAGASCTIYNGTNDYYVLGGEVPPDSFVPATESLE